MIEALLEANPTVTLLEIPVMPARKSIWSRFLVGGVVVSAFAMFGDVLRPKSFAGLFGAAPAVALATLGIAVYRHGPHYAAFQSQAMMAGAAALASTALSFATSLSARGCEQCPNAAVARRLASAC